MVVTDCKTQHHSRTSRDFGTILARRGISSQLKAAQCHGKIRHCVVHPADKAFETCLLLLFAQLSSQLTFKRCFQEDVLVATKVNLCLTNDVTIRLFSHRSGYRSDLPLRIGSRFMYFRFELFFI
jgi:hypothetical protein